MVETKTVCVTGEEAIHYAQALGCRVVKHPEEPGQESARLTVERARQIVVDDPGGVWLSVPRELMELTRSARFWQKHREQVLMSRNGCSLERAQTVDRDYALAVERLADCIWRHTKQVDVLKLAKALAETDAPEPGALYRNEQLATG